MAGRQSLMLSQEQTDELQEVFNAVDSDGNRFINVAELRDVLEKVNIKLPEYKVRRLIAEHDNKIKDDKLDFEEFQGLYMKLKEELDFGRKFTKVLSRKEDIEVHGGMSTQSAEGTTHTVKKEEQVAFSNWINRNLTGDEDCMNYLPLDQEHGHDLYTKCNDGILFCKMINISQPETIDERTMNKANGPQGYKKLSVYQIHENLTLAVNSASSIGCSTVNIGPEDLRAGKPHLVLGLLWQIIRIGLLSDINLQEHPNLAILLRDGETLEQLRALSPEEILIRWVNYHLERSNCGRQISNFTTDIKDSVAYIHLLNQIAPQEKGVTILAENEPDDLERAERMLQEAEKIECRSFVTPTDVVKGNPKLNLAFVANLFNMYPALDDVDQELIEIVEETREEKTYRNWMNSLGVSPYVTYLMSDLADGLIILQLEDIIRPGSVDWNKVHKKFNKMKICFEQLENCNQCVDVGKNLKLSLVGVSGDNIKEGSQVHILGILWQLLRLYTVSVLVDLKTKSDEHSQVTNGGPPSPKDNKPIVDAEIVSWANEKLKKADKKTSITSFSDPSISSGRVIIDLVDAIKKGCINYDLVTPGKTEEEKMSNAKYVISMSRKIGARVYALPEDIVEGEKKMVMTIFACLMARDMRADQRNL